MTRKIIRVDYKINNISNDGTIDIKRFDADKWSSKNRIMLTFLERNKEPAFITIPDDKIVSVAAAMFTAGVPEVKPDSYNHNYWSKLNWSTSPSRQINYGVVAFEQSEGVLIHENAASEDPDVICMVENECAMLAYLLNKFLFSNDFISEEAKECAV